MLYVETTCGASYSMHCGTKRNLRAEASIVSMIQADGHELTAICLQFTNLPHSAEGRCVRWYGDMAKFILGNLKL